MSKPINQFRLYLAELLFNPMMWLCPKDTEEGIRLLMCIRDYYAMTVASYNPTNKPNSVIPHFWPNIKGIK